MRTATCLLVLCLTACSGGGAKTVADGGDDGGGDRVGCLPGAEYPCDCGGQPTGAMLCQDDGGYAACECPLAADAG